MICVGVCGRGSERVVAQICGKYSDAGIEAERYSGSESDAEFGLFVAKMEKSGKKVVISETSVKNDRRKFDLLVVITAEKGKTAQLKNIRKSGCVIINADDCGAFVIPPGTAVVTCGVNSSAAVTFSGIGENRDGRESVQCCIQKEIRTVSGRKIEPQEFSINIVGKYPLSEVLAIIALAIAGDIEETVTSDVLV